MKKLFLSCFFIIFCSLAWSYVEPISLEELIKISEVICLAQVQDSVKIRTQKVWGIYKNIVVVEKTLKGSPAPKALLEIFTSHLEPQHGGMEDPPVAFPPKGGKVLIFLQKNEDGDYKLSNAHQGLWELKNQEPVSPWQPSIKTLEATIAKVKQKK